MPSGGDALRQLAGNYLASVQLALSAYGLTARYESAP